MRLNHSKTKSIMFNTRNSLSSIVNPTPFDYLGNKIDMVKSHMYLGIFLDDVMSLIPLFKNIKKRISNKIFHLKKLRKYMCFDASVLVYKQTILPIFDYAGFLLISLSNGDIDDLQILQNDILRICNRSRISDKVSLVVLHRKCNMLSLRQHMEKQLLGLMYIISKDCTFQHVLGRETRSADKIVFKVPSKIRPLYEHSSNYKGSKLWSKLDSAVQKSENIFVFKKEISRMYKKYCRD